MMQNSSLEKRRYEPRLPAYMAARIVAPGQVSPAPCVVLEISQAGAKLQIGNDWILPRTFWLRIDGDTLMHYCTLVWREGQHVGVEFPPGHDSSWWKHSQAIRDKQLPSRARV
jgi:hypothetical protein